MTPKPITNLTNLSHNPFEVAPSAEPSAQRFTVLDQSGDEITFTGDLLGTATTQRDEHTCANYPTYPARRGERCFACRWFEASIYRVRGWPAGESRPFAADTRFMVVTVGGTSVPGEVYFHRAMPTSSGFEVIELLTIRKTGAQPYMSMCASRALSQAAGLDELIRDAWVNRAVV